MNSLDLLFATVASERDRQLTHFESLDSKASVVLGFAGTLIALAGGLPLTGRLPAALVLAGSAAAAVASFWPRRLPSLAVIELRDYLSAEMPFTKLTLHDTYLEMIEEGSSAIHAKARLLKLAMGLLGAGGAILAIGVALGGGHV